MNQIVVELLRVSFAGIDSSRCGCVMRTTHGFPCACELTRYVIGNIPLDVIRMFWRMQSFLDEGLFDPKVSIIEEMKPYPSGLKSLIFVAKLL